MSKVYWHFSAANDKGKPFLGYGDGRIIRAGVTHKVKGNIKLCEFGLHASERPIDALKYAPGPYVALCTLGGEVIHRDDKSVASERTYLWVANAEVVMREFSRWCALQVCHLLDCPPVVKEYLETGNESIMDAARAAAARAAAASAAARDAAMAAATMADAWAAAWDAASEAAWAAATMDAARDAEIDKQNKKFQDMLMSLAPKDYK